MFSRSRGPKKALFVHKTRGKSKVRKSKNSSPNSDGAVTSYPSDSAMSVFAHFFGGDGSKLTEEEIASMRATRDWCNETGCAYYNPTALRDALGEKPSNQVPDYTCPHQGNKNPFSFISCTPDCKRSAPMASVGRWTIKDNSSAPGTDEGQKASKPLKLRVPSAPIPLLEDWLKDPRGHVSRYLVSASARYSEN